MTNQTPPTSVVSSRPLVLGIVNGSTAEQQQIAVSGVNCIIGSSEFATIRLRANEVSDCHCEIVRNPAGVYVRQLSGGITVNGQPLEEAWIFTGDRLVLAGFEMVVADVGLLEFQDAHAPHSEKAPSVNPAIVGSQLNSQVEASPAADLNLESNPGYTQPKTSTPGDSSEPGRVPQPLPVPQDPAPANPDTGAGNHAPVLDEMAHTDFIVSESNAPAVVADQRSIYETQPIPVIEPASQPIDQVQPRAETNLQSTTPSPAPASGADGIQAIADKISGTWGADQTEQQDQEEWLDQLYGQSPQAAPAQQPVAPSPGPTSWADDSIAPQLRQPNLDPSEFKHLPQPSMEETNRVLDKIEEYTSTQTLDDPNSIPERPAVAPAASSEVSPQQESFSESGSFQIPDVATVLKELQEETRKYEEQQRPLERSFMEETHAEVEETFLPNNPVPEIVNPVAEDHSSVADAVPSEEPVSNAEQSSASELANSESAAPEPAQAESVAEVLARMRMSGAIDTPLPGEDDFEADPTQNPEAAFAPTAAVNSIEQPVVPAMNTDSPSNDADDDSVKDYMNQLMQRLRGDAPPVKEPVVVAKADKPKKTASVAKASDDLTPENPMTASEFIPNKVEREKTSTLDALRQVANQSVENAIRNSAKEKSNETSLIYLGGSGACLFLSAVLFVLSKGLFDIAFILAIIFAVGCVAMGFMYLSINSAKAKLAAQQTRGKVNTKSKPAKPNKEKKQESS